MAIPEIPYQDFTGSVAPVPGSFTVTRSISTGVPGRTQAYRMVVQVTASDGIEPEIFLYHRMVIDPETGDTGDYFRKVCSPSDIEEFPINEPLLGSSLPYFRLSGLDMLFRSPDLLEETWQAILDDLEELGRTLTAISRLQSEVNVTVDFES